MLIFFCVIMHIITYKNKILHKWFYTLLDLYSNQKKWEIISICIRIVYEFYIYKFEIYFL